MTAIYTNGELKKLQEQHEERLDELCQDQSPEALAEKDRIWKALEDIAKGS